MLSIFIAEKFFCPMRNPKVGDNIRVKKIPSVSAAGALWLIIFRHEAALMLRSNDRAVG